MIFLKWYSIGVLILNLLQALRTQLNLPFAPKGYFLTTFVIIAPILFYLFTT